MTTNAELAMDQWRQEKPDIDLLPMELVDRLGTLSRIIRRDYLDPFLKQHGLQPGEYDVLATLRRAGSPYELTPTQLFEVLMISSGGMTNRLDRLEEAGLIQRTPNPDDRRGLLVSLTHQGLRMINAMLPAQIIHKASALEALNRKEQQVLNLLLGRLIDGLKI